MAKADNIKSAGHWSHQHIFSLIFSLSFLMMLGDRTSAGIAIILMLYCLFSYMIFRCKRSPINVHLRKSRTPINVKVISTQRTTVNSTRQCTCTCSLVSQTWLVCETFQRYSLYIPGLYIFQWYMTNKQKSCSLVLS